MTDFPKTSNEIARNIEQSINTTACNPFLVAKYMANNAHRYLCNEFFKVCLMFIHHLSDNFLEGRYDARNEYACKTANAITNLMEGNSELRWCRMAYNNDKEYYKNHPEQLE